METLTLNQLTKIITSQKPVEIPRTNIWARKFSAGLLIFLADVVVLTLALFISLLLRDVIFPGEVKISYYFGLLPLIILLFPMTFYLRGLYPGFGIDVIDELRTLTYSTTAVFAILATISFLIKDAGEYSRIAFLLSWLISLPMIPLGRALVRHIFGKKDWWGIPVIILGAGNAGEQVIKSLRKHYQIGLRPVVAVDDNIDRWGYIHEVPVVGGIDIVPDLIKKLKIDHAIVAMPNVPRKIQQEIIKNYSQYFSNTTVIPNLYGLESLWVTTRDLGGILGLEVQQRLLKKSSYIKKRIFDIFIASLLSLFALPFITLISILIRLDSRGKVFFRQERMGINDSRFSIVKFRTMYSNSEERLRTLLKNDPELKAEYDVYHKMKNDPRLTKVGKIIRKFSFDELPQFWNVIKGEMSLIGPRAYMPWEKVKMSGNEEMILKVKPGISGLWQVTDRNESSFEERNLTDIYYIRNWSMFLDIYILARTIAVVVLGKGAY